MTRGKAEDAGGLTPAKDDNAAPYHFDPRTLPIFMYVDYTSGGVLYGKERKDFRLFPILLTAVIPLWHKFRQFLFQFPTVIAVNQNLDRLA